MDMSAMTTTAAAAAATTSAAAMSMTDDSTCKISMLWNWYTIDACFVSSSWHITTNSMFAGSCIGIILLVMSLEFLRRLAKEYDRHILRQYQRHVLSVSTQSISESKEGKAVSCGSSSNDRRVPFVSKTFRPNMLQQFVRAILHTLQFAVAYLVMLLAMYYNGYFIICIIIGALLGSFVFSWESVDLEGPGEDATVCCG